MPRARNVKSSFVAGELSPRFFGRVDLPWYYEGAATIENGIVLKTGGVIKRPGTKLVAEVKDSNAGRLIEWQFNETQTYVLELTDQVIRFYSGGAQVLDMGSPLEVASPWLEAELAAIQYVQRFDVAYLVHAAHKTRTLTRTGAAAFTLANFAPTGDPFTSSDNYPSVCTLFDQRIHFGATNTDPAKWWASAVGDFGEFTGGSNDDDAFSRTLDANDRLSWMLGHQDMVIAAQSSAAAIQPRIAGARDLFRVTSEGATITPTDAGVERNDGPVLFVPRDQRTVRAVQYAFEDDALRGVDLMKLSRHLTGHEGRTATKQIVEITWQSEPWPVLWALRADGVLLGCTYDREEEVIAWHRHDVGGEVESIAIDRANGGSDLYMIVKRTINGATKRFVERMVNDYDPDEPETQFFVDSGLTYDGAATTTITGLDHLEGETVAILADGTPRPSQAVSSGQITLSEAASVVHVGLPYTMTVKTVPFSLPAQPGRARKVRNDEINLIVDTSGALKVNGKGIPTRVPSDPIGKAPPLTTGVLTTRDFGWDEDGSITIVSDTPRTATVIGMTGNVDVEA